MAFNHRTDSAYRLGRQTPQQVESLGLQTTPQQVESTPSKDSYGKLEFAHFPWLVKWKSDSAASSACGVPPHASLGY